MLTSSCPISKHSYHKIIQIIMIKYSVFICTESENCLGWNRPLEIIRLSYHGSSKLPLDLQVLGTTTDGLHYLSRQPTVEFDHPHITKYFLVFRLNSACAHCPLSYQWALLRRVWFLVLHLLPSGTWIRSLMSPLLFI